MSINSVRYPVFTLARMTRRTQAPDEDASLEEQSDLFQADLVGVWIGLGLDRVAGSS